MPEWILGLGGSDHDFSAALMRDCDIRVAIEQERVSRRKHGLALWYENPYSEAIDYCLTAEAISMSQIDYVVTSDLIAARALNDFREYELREFPHHLCHAASAYLMLPAHSRAGILVYDGYGSIKGSDDSNAHRNWRETFSFYIFHSDGYECLGQNFGSGFIERDDFPIGVTNSIGMLYELVTALIGYDLIDSGKTMGLSSHGVPRYLDTLERFISYHEEPSKCFRCATDDPQLKTEIEKILFQGRGRFEVKADLAASVQAIVNKTLLHCEQFFYGQQIEYLCLAGGCALNAVANSFLVENSILNVPVIIPPHCDDAGLAFGAFWLHRWERSRRSPLLTFCGSHPAKEICRPGRSYTSEECRRAVQAFYPRLSLDYAVSSARELASAVAKGAIVGLFRGKSEIGPRALGGRSIIADPRSSTTRERLNRLIKKREPFRPLAPMVLSSRYEDYFFDARCADPFMLKVARVKERCLREAPAVVHIDGTARVQVIQDDEDPFLVELLNAFLEETGVGVLLNTSFNRRDEPIVESPSDAIDAFLGMNLDGLYLNGQYYVHP